MRRWIQVFLFSLHCHTKRFLLEKNLLSEFSCLYWWGLSPLCRAVSQQWQSTVNQSRPPSVKNILERLFKAYRKMGISRPWDIHIFHFYAALVLQQQCDDSCMKHSLHIRMLIVFRCIYCNCWTQKRERNVQEAFRHKSWHINDWPCQLYVKVSIRIFCSWLFPAASKVKCVAIESWTTAAVLVHWQLCMRNKTGPSLQLPQIWSAMWLRSRKRHALFCFSDCNEIYEECRVYSDGRHRLKLHSCKYWTVIKADHT